MSKQGTWGSGQSPVAADLLVAIVCGSGTTSVTDTGTATAGWSQQGTINQGATFASTYTKIAAGSDTAPTFTATTTGTAGDSTLTITLYDLYDSSGETPGLFSIGTDDGTSATTLTPGSAGYAVPANSFSVCGMICGNGTTSASTTWTAPTTPATWTLGADQTAAGYAQSGSWYLQNATAEVFAPTMTHSRTSASESATFISACPPAPGKASTLVDNFATNDLSVNWDGPLTTTGTYAAVWSPGQVLVPTGNTTDYYAQLVSTNFYDLTSSSFSAYMIPALPDTAEDRLACIGLQIPCANGSGAAFVQFGYQNTPPGPGVLAFYFNDGQQVNNYQQVIYNVAMMSYLRLRESGGVLYGDTSPDNNVWTNQFSYEYLTPLTATFLGFYSWYTGTDVNSDATVKAVNIAGQSYPAIPLGVEAEMYLGTTDGWTSMTKYVYTRNPVTVSRGRQDESSSVQPQHASLTLDNRDNRFSVRNPTGPWYGLLSQNTPLRLSVPASVAGLSNYLRLADDRVSYASCPDATALHLTGNIDVRLDMWLDDYQQSSLVGKFGSTTATQAWALFLHADGTLAWFWNDGTTQNSVISTVPLPHLGRIMVRCFFDASAGEVLFYTAPNMSGSQTQLGSTISITAADYAQAATGQAVQVGYITGSADVGAVGMLYEMRLYNASSTLVANPVFSSQVAGTTSFSDGHSNTWTLSGTAEISDRLYRFHGELGSVPKASDPSGRDVYSKAEADGVLRRLQQGNTPVQSTLRRYYATLGGTTGLAAYWPCEDGVGSTSIAAGIPGVQPMLFAYLTPTFSNQVGSSSADSQFPCSAGLPTLGQSSLYGVVPQNTVTWNANVVRFLIYETAGSVNNGGVLFRVNTTGTVQTFDLIYYTGGALGVNGYSASGSSLFSTGAVGYAIDGVPLRMSMELTVSGGTITVNLVTLKPGASTGSQLPATTTSGSIGAVTSVTINPGGLATASGVEIGQVSVEGTWTSLFDFAEPLNAYNGETAAARVGRLVSESGVNSRVYGFPGASTAMGYQPVDTLPNLLTYCEATDMGLLFETRQVLGIGYRTRESMCSQTPVVTADYSQQEVSQGFAATADDLLAINQVTMSNADGSGATAALTSGPMSTQAPPDGIGVVDTSVTVYPETDSQLNDLAGWYLNVRSASDDRYPSIPFQMARTQTPAAIPILDVGDYLQITNGPAWTPPPPIRQLAAGYAEQLGPGREWPVTVNGIPEAPYETASFGTNASDSSHFDTDGSTLSSSATSAATTLSVATTGAASALWTTAAADFPFDILVSGERITVTSISGSSSPQTFTVTRSVNGVVKAQASNTTVVLYNTPIASLL